MHKTKGIVLRAVKYGETSLIVSVYTELFGLQSYLINGVRKSSSKGSGRASLLQPPSILDMVVYHNPLRNLQRVKEFRYAKVYENIFFDVVRNSVALFMVELLTKTIRQPEANASLYLFIEDAFLQLDRAGEAVVANYPLFFCVHLAGFFGFRIHDNYSDERHFLDLEEGFFTAGRPNHSHYVQEPLSSYLSWLLKVMQPEELQQVRLNHALRRNLLHGLLQFYTLHISEFGEMKTVPVLQAVFSD